MKPLALLTAVIFFLIACLHIHWAFRRRRSGSAVLPQKADGAPVFVPGAPACLAVAAALLAAAAICLMNAAMLPPILPPAVTGWMLRMIGIVFLLRVVGDFRYVGLFRRVKHTDFAIQDARLYTPLSAAIGIASLLLSSQ